MHITVTGSQGRVGRQVVSRLLALGHDVTCVDLRKPEDPLPLGARFIQTDLLDPALAELAVEQAETVVHLAAMMSWNKADSARLFAANVQAGFTLLNAVQATSRAQLIVASSGEVYPEGSPRYLPIDEAHPREPRSPYGMTKLLLEDMVWFFSRTYDMPATIIRLPHTQDATELLDPQSPLSGPRFFLHRKIEQQLAFGNHQLVAQLQALDDGTEKLLLSRGADGTPYRMPIADTRDIAAGIVSAVFREQARGHSIALGPNQTVDFEAALPRMSELTGLPIVTANLPGPAISYSVDISLARKLLDFTPHHDFESMLLEANEGYQHRFAQTERTAIERRTS